MGRSGLFRLLRITLYSWSLTFTSADSPLCVVLDFDYRQNNAGHTAPTRECPFYDQSCYKHV